LRTDEDSDFAKLQLGFFDDGEVLDGEGAHRASLVPVVRHGVLVSGLKGNRRSFDSGRSGAPLWPSLRMTIHYLLYSQVRK
jgi:hypothetical protein